MSRSVLLRPLAFAAAILVWSAAAFAQTAAPDPLEAAAVGYDHFTRSAENASTRLPRNHRDIQKTLSDLTALSARELGMSWVANLALSAAESQAFANGIRRAATAEGSPDRLIDRLLRERTAVMKIAGAAEGLSRMLDQVKADDVRLSYLAGALEDVARGRKVRVRPFSVVVMPRPRPAKGIVQIVAASTQAGSEPRKPMPPWSAGTEAQPSVFVRSMNLAALRILGQSAQPARAADVSRLMDAGEISACLGWAQTNLSQCRAASRGANEVTFCAYTHAVADVAKCFNWMVPAKS